jgi:hypothetical protein
MLNAKIQCASSGHVYSIPDAEIIGGLPEAGTKVSTEIGCPKCLDPDGIIITVSFVGPIDESVDILDSEFIG